MVKNLFVLKGGMSKKQRQSTADALAAVPLGDQRVILATGSYIGEGFDDARLKIISVSLCQFPGKELSSNMSGDCIDFMTTSMLFRVYDYVDWCVSDAGSDVRATAERICRHRVHRATPRKCLLSHWIL